MSFLERVVAALEKHKVPYSLVGGYAVALHGAVRGTADIDLIIRQSQRNFEACELALGSIGLQSRLPVSAKEVYQFRDEYIKNRNLIAWSFVNPSNPLESVDVVITHDLNGLSSITKKLKAGKVRILSINDLIAMKKASRRPQDIEDVKSLEQLL